MVLHEKEKKGEVLCFGCFKSIKEYDVVEVIAQNPEVSEAAVGHSGAVLMVFNSPDGETAYEVESVNNDGTTKWVGTFRRSHIKWRQSPTE